SARAADARIESPRAKTAARSGCIERMACFLAPRGAAIVVRIVIGGDNLFNASAHAPASTETPIRDELARMFRNPYRASANHWLVLACGAAAVASAQQPAARGTAPIDLTGYWV